MSGLSGAATGVADFGTDQWKYEAGVAFVGSLAEDTLGGHPPRWIAALGAGAGAGLWEKWGKEKLKRWFGENPLSQASGKFVSKVIKEVFGAEAELAEHEVAEFLKGFMRAIEKAEEALDYWEQQFNDWFWMDDRDPIH